MFTKNVISQDMIDAVNSILMQEEKKEMLLEPGKKMELETGFHMAAHAAKKANQTHFEFQGKKYPVTAKSTAEAIEEKNKFDPLKHVKNPTPGEKAAAKDVKRGSYADRAAMLRSAQADGRLKEEIEELDELSKKTLTSYRIKSIGRDADFEKKGYQAAGKGPGNEKSDRLFNKSDLVTTARDSAKRKLMNSEAIEEEKDDDSMYTTKAQAKKIADKEAAKEVHKHEKNLHKGSKETKFDEERHMSDDEMAKREKIVKSMKKGMAGFKERYGNRAKNVMYATATKQAMKEEVQEAAGGVTVKKEYDDKDESEHGVYHGKKKIGYVVHDKKTDTHTAYHGHKYGKDDYENSDDFPSHKKAVNQIKSSAGLKEEETSTKKVTPKKESIGGIVGAGDGLGNVKEDMKVDTLAGPTSIKNIPKKQADELKDGNGHESLRNGKLISAGDAAPEPRNNPPYKVKAFEAKTPGGQIDNFTPSVDQPLKERVKDMAKRKFRKENMSGLTLSDQ